MSEEHGERKLAAILSADVAGYSRLMADDERATVRTLGDCRIVFAGHIARHHGRLVDSPGDNLLAEFASPVEAVACALEVQRELARRNAQLADHRRMHFRIGVNLGDVIEKEGALYGDGVNLAARLEALSEPGGICVSGIVHEAVEGKIEAAFEDLGTRQVKNILKPVRVFRVVAGERAPAPRRRRAARRPALILAGVALCVGLIALGLWAYPAWFAAPAPESTATTEVSVPDSEDAMLALPKGPGIAVLPFANLSGDPEQEYFSDGMTEELITKLSRFQDLRVIARQSTMQYKNQAVDTREIGRHLSVRYVVEGSVRRANTTVRVTAQLIDTEDGAHLWAETYDRALAVETLLAVQDDIARQIVATIADSYGIIMRNLAKESSIKPPEDLIAYECTLLYYESSLQGSIELVRRAIQCLEEATRKYPNYAAAWGYLAELYAEDYGLGFNTVPDALDRALEAGRRAVVIDPASQQSHWGLAWAHYLRHERQPCLDELEKALALNPNRPYLVGSIGWVLAQTTDWGSTQWQRGMALIEKGTQLNPHYPGWMLYPELNDQYMRGEYERALEVVDRINMPEVFHDPMNRAAILAQMGRSDEAAAALRDAVKLKPDLGSDVRRHLSAYIYDLAVVERLLDGLRKAGLEIPPETN